MIEADALVENRNVSRATGSDWLEVTQTEKPLKNKGDKKTEKR